MARRLHAVGLRAINNVVDVTNYVMLDAGQPLHAFDFDKLLENRIIVRLAKAGESIVSLDGKERKLEPTMLVIADARRPVAIAGVMGGADTEVTASTTSVLLESALFDGLSIRKTARALTLRSDSSYRFERGLDPEGTEASSQRAAMLIAQTAGGVLSRGSINVGSAPASAKPLSLRLSKLRRCSDSNPSRRRPSRPCAGSASVRSNTMAASMCAFRRIGSI